MRSISDTSDVLHDAIVGTLQRLPSLAIEQPEALQGYLRQSILNRIADEHRRVARRGVAEPLSPAHADRGDSPFDAVVGNELQQRYKRALKTLKVQEQMLLVGHVELGYSAQQLACMSGKRLGATRMALRRAIQRLAHAMKG
jgi:RNA polymerase sigma factor (sigma-70 family)